MKICSIDGCDRKFHAQNVCFRHYNKLRYKGVIKNVVKYSGVDHIVHNTIVNEITGCWEWSKCRMPQGYGVTELNKKSILSHRYSYIAHFGEIAAGKSVLHKCDNPPCCNPDHLFFGTQADNMEDMKQKGRHKAGFGEKHRKARLKEGDVLKIRKLSSDGIKSKEISDLFGIPINMVYQIKNNVTWKHLLIKG